jgi:RNA polymerase sigma-70 factor, ECF subfamily
MASVAFRQTPALGSFTVPTADGEWLSRLYESTFHAAYRMAQMLVRDPDTAEDVVADAFLRAWASRDRFDPARPALPWILSITRNCALDTLRRRRPCVELDSVPDQEDPAVEDDAEMHLDEAALACLSDGIAKLNAEQQQVVLLRFYEGLPHQAIADRLGKTAAAVRVIQFRALQQLRKHLEAARV